MTWATRSSPSALKNLWRRSSIFDSWTLATFQCDFRLGVRRETFYAKAAQQWERIDYVVVSSSIKVILARSRIWEGLAVRHESDDHLLAIADITV